MSIILSFSVFNFYNPERIAKLQPTKSYTTRDHLLGMVRLTTARLNLRHAAHAGKTHSSSPGSINPSEGFEKVAFIFYVGEVRRSEPFGLVFLLTFRASTTRHRCVYALAGRVFWAWLPTPAVQCRRDPYTAALPTVVSSVDSCSIPLNNAI